MWNNALASRMTGIPTMSIGYLRRSMDLSKPQEHDMNALEISLFLILAMLIYLYAKYMSMTYYLVLLIKSLVRSLVG
jgi:hypothetical protein